MYIYVYKLKYRTSIRLLFLQWYRIHSIVSAEEVIPNSYDKCEPSSHYIRNYFSTKVMLIFIYNQKCNSNRVVAICYERSSSSYLMNVVVDPR